MLACLFAPILAAGLAFVLARGFRVVYQWVVASLLYLVAAWITPYLWEPPPWRGFGAIVNVFVFALPILVMALVIRCVVFLVQSRGHFTVLRGGSDDTPTPSGPRLSRTAEAHRLPG